MALPDAQYQILTPAQISQKAQDGYKDAAQKVSDGNDAWRNVAKLYAGAEDSPTWQNLKAADVAADVAKGNAAEVFATVPGASSSYSPPSDLEQLGATPWSFGKKLGVGAGVAGGVVALGFAIHRWVVPFVKRKILHRFGAAA